MCRESLLDSFEQALVEQALVRIEFNGVRYSLVGATGSAKNGKFYAVDTAHEKKIAERFRSSPQAAITYFGILVSSCKVRIEEPDCRVLVVEDHELGTNDCRGWISQSLFLKLNLPAHRFYQFRLAFDKTQAKGSFKVMGDDVAQKLETDIILPKSAVKPDYRGGLGTFLSVAARAIGRRTLTAVPSFSAFATFPATFSSGRVTRWWNTHPQTRLSSRSKPMPSRRSRSWRQR